MIDFGEDAVRTGMAWYKPEQWAYLLKISTDRNKLEKTFEEWLEFAEGQLEEYKSTGMIVEKVTVDVYELEKWCKKKKCPVNAKSRANYAALLIRKLYEETNED